MVHKNILTAATVYEQHAAFDACNVVRGLNIVGACEVHRKAFKSVKFYRVDFCPHGFGQRGVCGTCDNVGRDG